MSARPRNKSFSGPVASYMVGNPSALASDYAATITWGDGHASAGTVSIVNGLLTVSGTNTYATGGSYGVGVTISGPDGASTTSTATVANLSADGRQRQRHRRPGLHGPVATFTDVNSSAPLSDYTATIQWDNNPAHTSAGTISLVGGVLTVSGTNTYAERVLIRSASRSTTSDGSSANATSTATVADAALSATGVNVSATKARHSPARWPRSPMPTRSAVERLLGHDPMGQQSGPHLGRHDLAGIRRVDRQRHQHLCRKGFLPDQRHDQRYGWQQCQCHQHGYGGRRALSATGVNVSADGRPAFHWPGGHIHRCQSERAVERLLGHDPMGQQSGPHLGRHDLAGIRRADRQRHQHLCRKGFLPGQRHDQRYGWQQCQRLQHGYGGRCGLKRRRA